ncbi:hypothetical protein GUITHDRAFT_111863 [Guillardia theta CCMP2712]|uniref:Uncharacterized protein n=1 Tax=Guillardia theta (strain CCMP2712) TaxID=905079 RepID=L1J1J2_GUITC|nr:hypothetical protein GUITHDRAFT_111863 [Guillardia theta CCMP2712]EKX42009.1 hypothetical protein GUITHDRAFT_111863 [Guillardia theta CCMP2712]|eukprot:XP_005828989.1 hypothetical protein GUITHDRAFT_111863 [Guillardia theta CCMP2712]
MVNDEDERDLFSDMGTYHAICLARARSKDRSDRTMEWKHVPRCVGLVRLRHGAVIPKEMQVNEIGRVHVARPLTKDSITDRPSHQLKMRAPPQRPSTAPPGARQTPVDDLANLICTLDRSSLRSLIGVLQTRLEGEGERDGEGDSGQMTKRSSLLQRAPAVDSRQALTVNGKAKPWQVRIAANGSKSNRSSLPSQRSVQVAVGHQADSSRSHWSNTEPPVSGSHRASGRSAVNVESNRSRDPRKETLVRFLQTVFKPHRYPSKL